MFLLVAAIPSHDGIIFHIRLKREDIGWVEDMTMIDKGLVTQLMTTPD